MEGIWCVGAGAVGGVVAARLARAGLRPRVIDANREHVARLRFPGLIVDGDGDVPVRLDAMLPDEAAARADECRLVLLSVRSEHTERALAPLASRLSGDVVSLQNGLNEERIAALVGTERTIGCVVGFGSTYLDAGRIELTASGQLVIGRLDGSQDERLHAARETLERAFETVITGDIEAALWSKMLVNSVTVLGALGGVLMGEVLSAPYRPIVAQVIAEGVEVALASGVKLGSVFGVDAHRIRARSEGWRQELDQVLDMVAMAYGSIKSVTLRDFERGHPIEIDAVTGQIVQRAATLGIPLALNSRVYELLREIDAGRRRPERENYDILAAALPAA